MPFLESLSLKRNVHFGRIVNIPRTLTSSDARKDVRNGRSGLLFCNFAISVLMEIWSRERGREALSRWLNRLLTITHRYIIDKITVVKVCAAKRKTGSRMTQTR